MRRVFDKSINFPKACHRTLFSTTGNGEAAKFLKGLKSVLS